MTAGRFDKIQEISKDYSKDEALDYNLLYKRGIELIQLFSGEEWTDFNTHDPGVTFLEYLCFAITDLAYRTNFPITDLLAQPDGKINTSHNSFVSRAEILTTAPITISDFRKMIIDRVEEVDNIWLEPVLSKFSTHHIHGRYRITVRLGLRHLRAAINAAEWERNILIKVRDTLNQLRNICEYFDEIIAQKPQALQIVAQVQVSTKHNADDLLARIYHELERFLNPRERFYSEAELLSKDYRPEDIYDGPLLRHGILPDEDLQDLITEVDPSVLARIISQVPGIQHVQELSLICDGKTYTSEPLIIKSDHFPYLEFDTEAPGIRLFTDNMTLHSRQNVFVSMLERLRDISDKHTKYVSGYKENIDAELTGTYRNPGAYDSIQKLIPAVFQLGQDEPGLNDTPERKAMTRQLKAYLVFFEQILANYLAQLASLDEIFSPQISGNNANTYAYQPLYGVPGIRYLLKSFTDNIPQESWEQFKAASTNGYLKTLSRITESDGTYQQRKARLLSHLLSRFNLAPDEYPVRIFEMDYQRGISSGRASEEVKWKSRLLTNILAFTRDRLKAPNLNIAKPNQAESGFAYNICLLLHIKNTSALARLAQVPGNILSRKGKANAGGRPPDSVLRSLQTEGEQLSVYYTDDAATRDSFNFNSQPVSFFSTGTDIRNFRIIADPENKKGEQMVLFKNPDDKYWQPVRRYADADLAGKGIKTWIETLVRANINSEGFHLIEHSLLAPEKDASVFGFTFYGMDGSVLLQQKALMTFKEREDVLAMLLEKAVGGTKDDVIAGIRKYCLLATVAADNNLVFSDIGDETAGLSEYQQKRLDDAVIALGYFSSTNRFFYPKFAFTVQRWDAKMISERFFESRVTVVLPSWPKRFQHDDFRQFVHTTFREKLPAHINVSLLWLGIPDMDQFEDVYLQWAGSLEAQNKNIKRINSEGLITILMKHKISD